MKTNVEKVLERDQKLSELDDRAGKVLPLPKTFFSTVIYNFLQMRCSRVLRNSNSKLGN